jgi:hypothetical protein
MTAIGRIVLTDIGRNVKVEGMTTTFAYREAGRVMRPLQRGADPDVRLNPWLLWRPEAPDERMVLTVAELAECRCPDLCDRDHANE